MKLFRHIPILSLCALLLQHCGITSSRIAASGVYDEDLSIYRDTIAASFNQKVFDVDTALRASNVKRIDIIPSQHIGYELDSVINIMIEARKDVKYLDGYTIQLYSGNDRYKASNIRASAAMLVQDVSPKISYEQPNYKVKFGQYFTRLEANVHYARLKKEFSRAVLVPARIPIDPD